LYYTQRHRVAGVDALVLFTSQIAV